MLKRVFSRLNSFSRYLKQDRPRRRRRFGKVVSTEQLETRTMLSGAPVLIDFDHDESTNAMISGTVTNSTGSDTSLNYVSIEVDTNDDGFGDYFTSTASNGDYSVDVGTLSGSSATIAVRASDMDASSDWVQYTISLPDPPQVVASSIAYTAGTTAELTGSITSDGSVANNSIDLDLNNDGTADAFATTDANGDFTISFSATNNQQITVKLRARSNNGSGDWVSHTFTPVNAAPTLTSSDLDNDNGASSTDFITSDATIAGSISNDSGASGLQIEIDVDDDGMIDYTTTTDANGDYSIDLTSYLTDGEYDIKVRVVESLPGETLASQWSTLSFELDSTI